VCNPVDTTKIDSFVMLYSNTECRNNWNILVVYESDNTEEPQDVF